MIVGTVALRYEGRVTARRLHAFSSQGVRNDQHRGVGLSSSTWCCHLCYLLQPFCSCRNHLAAGPA